MAMGPIPGLPGQIWTQFLAAMAYFQNNLDSSNPENSLGLIEGMSATCTNALDALTAYSYYTAGQTAYGIISQVLTYNLNLSFTTQVTDRINALQSTLTALSSYLNITFSKNISDLSNGKQAITAQSMVEFFTSFNEETPPNGLSSGDFLFYADLSYYAWQDVVDKITVSPITNPGLVYDACVSMLNSSTVSYNEVFSVIDSGEIKISSNNIDQSWNGLVALPSILRFLSQYVNDPSSLLSQQISVTRQVILGAMAQLNTLILSIKAQLSSNIAVATLPMGKTLMDVAAAKLGNYEDWTSIAAVNQLNPPYIGVGANLAEPGSRIFLQAPTTSSGTPVNPPNYEINYLGIDLYYGPLNQDMLPWTGDFQTIQGYQNLSLSLGRRLQTTLGTLMYDSEFGSRIPPEIGEIQSQDTAAHILAYASSALLSDPRVQTVASASVIRNPDGSINYSGVVIPNGSSGNGANVNEVLQPI
ncbi:MAG: hypothetical protein ACYCOU_04255 [Sulfobacillus sp.]